MLTPKTGSPSIPPAKPEDAQASGVGAPQWTPGPWWIQENGGEYEICAEYPGRPEMYAVLMTTDTPCCLPGTWFDGKAVAQLAAAAPELYEALEWMVQRADALKDTDATGIHQTEGLQRARAALAKARGESA